MFPIINSKGAGLSFEEFNKKMIEICRQHHKQNRALLFAFVLYDFEEPELCEIFHREEYLQAIDSLSDKYLTVFCLMHEKANKNSSSAPHAMEMLTSIKTKRNPSMDTNDMLLTHFNSLNIKYPSLLFFQVNDERVIDSFAIELKEEKIEDSFIEIRQYLRCAVNALKEIDPTCTKNFPEILEVVSQNIQRLRKVRFYKKLFNFNVPVVGFIKTLLGLPGK